MISSVIHAVLLAAAWLHFGGRGISVCQVHGRRAQGPFARPFEKLEKTIVLLLP